MPHSEYPADSVARQKAGVIAQTQPKFIANRDIFEGKFAGKLMSSYWLTGAAREKKAKLYSWQAFCFGTPASLPLSIPHSWLFSDREQARSLQRCHIFLSARSSTSLLGASCQKLGSNRRLTSYLRYPVVGFSFAPGIAGPVYLQMTFYEFLYTGIGNFDAQDWISRADECATQVNLWQPMPPMLYSLPSSTLS